MPSTSELQTLVRAIESVQTTPCDVQIMESDTIAGYVLLISTRTTPQLYYRGVLGYVAAIRILTAEIFPPVIDWTDHELVYSAPEDEAPKRAKKIVRNLPEWW